MPSLRHTLPLLLCLLAGVGHAVWERANSPPRLSSSMTRLEMAEYLLGHNPDSDNAIGHSRDIVDGRPAKTWKNCILEKAVDEAFVHQSTGGIAGV